MPYPRRDRSLLGAVVLSYLVLGLTYALVTPPLESSDEYKHYPVVQYIQTEHALPVLDPDSPGRWLQEGAQPPLYYAIMALLTSWIDTGDLPQVHRVNPHAFIGNPNQVTNKNLIIHQPEREVFPWHGTILAVMVIRLASVGIGAGTIYLVARLGRSLFSPRVGLLAAALTAFNPMFLFVSAAVNNDSLAILFGTLGLYLLVQLWQEAPDPLLHWHRYAGLGVVLGLGLLTKVSLGALLALAGVTLACLAWQRRESRLLFIGGVMVAVVALAIPSWWFARNLRLYHDPTGMNVFFAVQGRRDSPIAWSDWSGEFGTFFRSFWGLFGGVNIAAPAAYYWVCNLTALTGAAGLLLRWRRNHPPGQRGIWLLAAWSLIMFVLLLRWNVIYIAFQGRLIFPALAAINVLWAVGTLAWTGEARPPSLALLLCGWMLGAAVILPWSTIRPAYAYPQPLTSVPDTAQFGPISFQSDGGTIQLVGVEMPSDQSVTPAGKPVEVTLYWQAIGPAQRDYVSSVHLLGRQLVSVGQVNRYPAWGMIPTSQWQSGDIWRDPYLVYAGAGAEAPTRLRVSVGLYDTQESSSLRAVGPDGVPLELVLVGEVRLAAPESRPVQPPQPLEIPFADGITLVGYGLAPQPASPGETLTVTLYWTVVMQPTQEYTIFVHLLKGSAQLAVADGPPAAGDYPTSMWRAGDTIEDSHLISLPPDLRPGDYSIAVGLYDPVTGSRAARLDGAGDSASLPAVVEVP
jgi:4-amino-4-deoxy-L-arabinose transferase-like glycosyltransferase